MNNIKIAAPSLIILSILFFSCEKRNKMIETQVPSDSLVNVIGNFSVDQQRLESNKKLVGDFYQELFGDKDVSSIDKYIGDTYVQHNPTVADGKEALRQAATQWFKGAPKEKIDIQHLNAEGDFVYIHTRSKMGNQTISTIDIFRIENSKIVEHWDVRQEVPEKSANAHPMF